MKTRIIQRGIIDKKVWDEFVWANKDGYVYHLYDMICLDRYVEDKDISFAIWDDDRNEIVCVCMLHIEEKYNGDILLHSRYGNVLKDDMTPKQTRKICQAYMEYIDALIKKTNAISLAAGTPPLAESGYPTENRVVNPLMKFGYGPSMIAPQYTWILNLKGTEQQLVSRCEQTTRQAIRKIDAEKKYIVIEAKNNSDDLKTYIKLHEETYIRTGASHAILDIGYQKNIFEHLIPEGICRVFFLKCGETDMIIASVALLIYKNSGYYWWGASSNEKEVGINKYLLWRSMMIVKQDYYSCHSEEENYWFELGGAYPYLRQGKKKGLSDFKKCFGCTLHPIFRGEYIMPDM